MPVKDYTPIQHHHDVLIIGAGGAGLRAALAASQKQCTVAVLTKVPPTRSHTVAAQGGINAALGNRGVDDWRWHAYDTIRGSDWLSDQDAVAVLCEHAPAAIRELEHMGVPFTRAHDGKIYQRAYGGQATDFGKGNLAYRACAAADRTGHAILHTLYGQCIKHNVAFYVEYSALDLVMDGGECRGVLAWELGTGHLHVFSARTTIIATGGFGNAYASTTSSSICTGDGNAMALRAGLPLQDMEFVQFHPTGLYGTGVLITEGARGEGGFLVNGRGERFMENYAPHYVDLASRDVISRAIVQEIMAGRGCGVHKDHVYLRMDHLNPAMLREKLPTILTVAKQFAKVDATRDPIPVLPAVHYTMGGIPTDAHCRVIANAAGDCVEGLLAVGEAACNSVHGANRLGCNSLLDLMVFGKIAGNAASKKASAALPTLAAEWLEKPLAHLDSVRKRNGTRSPGHFRKSLQQIMQNHAAIYRNATMLKTGLEKLEELSVAMQCDMHIGTGMIWNNNLSDALEVSNLLAQAQVTLASALVRTESRGAHWREDFPERDDENWLMHSLAFLDDDGKITLKSRDVRMSTGTVSMPTILPEKRLY